MAKVPKITRMMSEASIYQIQQEEKQSKKQIIQKADDVIHGSQYMDLNEEERFGDVQSKGKERIATHITVYNRSKVKKPKRSRQSTKSAKNRE